MSKRSCGIVGLPNVGKSTFFNAMTASKIAATGNFPFCTIKANISKIPVYDQRLTMLQSFCRSEKIVPSEIGIADVAGLIAGAHKGEGLGNQFLNDIRNVNVVLHMVRCFEDQDNGFPEPTPVKDIHVINSELILADLAVVEKRATRMKVVKKKDDPELEALLGLADHLQNGKPARSFFPLDSNTGEVADSFSKKLVLDLQLLSQKPVVYIMNLHESAFARDTEKYRNIICQEFEVEPVHVIPACAAIEEQTSQMCEEDRKQFLEEYGLSVPTARAVTRVVYDLLGLQTFFTVGPIMAHSWSIRKGTTAKKAAGEIHSSFDEHFKAARTLAWDKFITFPSLAAAEEAMEVRNASYVLGDGEVMLVYHNSP
eukprot:PhF_6_TR5187/c0_g1_i1/m.7462/K06942/ychF; ribosome-binding ATPase